jgi:hypothetical protein
MRASKPPTKTMQLDPPTKRPASILRGPERWRLLTGILMLVVLGMLITQSANPSNWRWLASAKSAEQPAVKKEKKIPAPTGPTDEDREQADAAREELQAVTDGTLQLGPEEMEAYNRFVSWTDHQSFARLWQRAHHDVWYTNLYDAPNKRRGKLVALDIEVARAQQVGNNRDGVPLTEVWGTTEESRGRLYALIVVGYPKGMPTGFDIRREYGKVQARFAGYFLKLQGYQPASAKPGQPPERAPLLVGRLEWLPAPAPLVDNTSEWIWGGGILGVVAVVLAVWYFFFKPKGRPSLVRPHILAPSTGEVIPNDVWLEEKDEGRGMKDEG